MSTAVADLRGVARLGGALVRGDVPVREIAHQLGRGGAPESLFRQAIRFGVIGVLSTLAYLLLFLVFRAPLGAQAANFTALLITAIANTAVNRRFTFGVRGAGAWRHQAQGLLVFALGLALTSGALAALAAITAQPARWVEVAVLVLANLASTVLRFVLLREWVFHRKGHLVMTTYATTSPHREWCERRRVARYIAPLALDRTTRATPRSPLAALLLGTALLYLIGLSASGWANQYYSAAAEAGSKSWTAFLFGSLDSSNFITVDKPPASLWVMDLSVRIFGLNSWSVLVPQALEGVAAVALLYAAVKRVATPSAGLLAGAILATTPIATLMFRFNNPDALLVLLMTAAAYATVRAIENARGRWLALAGVLLGFAFLTKMMQGFLVVPGVRDRVPGRRARTAEEARAAHARRRRRDVRCRRLVGRTRRAVAGRIASLHRRFDEQQRPRTDLRLQRHRPAHRLEQQRQCRRRWQRRILLRRDRPDPAVRHRHGDADQLAAAGRARRHRRGRLGDLADAADQPAARQPDRLGRLGDLHRRRAELRQRDHPPVLHRRAGAGHRGDRRPRGLVAVGACARRPPRAGCSPRSSRPARSGRSNCSAARPTGRRGCAGPCCCAALAVGDRRAAAARGRLAGGTTRRRTLLAAPTAYSLQTAATAHTGALPTAGPAARPASAADAGRVAPAARRVRRAARRDGTTGGFGGRPATNSTGTGGSPRDRAHGRAAAPAAARGAMPGGLGGASTVSSRWSTALAKNAADYEWVAATVSANNAASIELATEQPVMSLGGFNGTDPAITLAEFKQLVAAGKIHYFVADGQGFIGSTAANTSTAYAIQQWVEANYTATTIGTRPSTTSPRRHSPPLPAGRVVEIAASAKRRGGSGQAA